MEAGREHIQSLSNIQRFNQPRMRASVAVSGSVNPTLASNTDRYDIRQVEPCESKAERGREGCSLWSVLLYPLLLTSKLQVDPYEPSVIDATPRTSQSGPLEINGICHCCSGWFGREMTWDNPELCRLGPGYGLHASGLGFKIAPHHLDARVRFIHRQNKAAVVTQFRLRITTLVHVFLLKDPLAWNGLYK